MTYSEIKITFTEDLVVGSELNIYNSFSALGIGTIWTEKWQNTRSQTNQVNIGTPTENIGERAAIAFGIAFGLDYNFPIQYEFSRVVNVITIKSMIPEQTFLSGELLLGGEPISGVTFEITNFVGTAYELEEIVFSQAIESCTKIKVGIKTTELSTSILSPFTLVENTDNPFYFDAFRGQGIIVTTKNSAGQQISFNVIVPDVLAKDNFILNPSNTPNGGTLNIVKNNSYGLDVQYSINGTDFQTNPYFSGLEPGVYTLWIKDQYGCRFNIPFFISEFNIQNPYFYYSKSNSIRMAERNNELPNDENSLSCESLAKLPYKEIQRFNESDIITVQFKSNLSTNEAKVINENNLETNLIVDKKTNNIGNKEKRDAVIYKFSNFKSGIYFINGNIYNYDTNAVVDDYSLNGLLPNWAEIGKYISIDSIWYLIENIVYVESKNADVIVISRVSVYPMGESVIVGSIYNIQNYEVYETTIVMANFLNQNIRLEINAYDSEFETKNYLSEVLNIQEKQKDCLEIFYFNIDNNDVFYQTGIKHLLRLPFTKINGYFDDNSENNKTDSTVISLNATLYEGTEFIFEPVTKEIWRKLSIALSHKFVFINDVGYVKDGEIEVDGALEDTNLYVVTAKMLKTGKVYSNLSVGSIDLATDPIIEIPGMIEWDGGFIEQ